MHKRSILRLFKQPQAFILTGPGAMLMIAWRNEAHMRTEPAGNEATQRWRQAASWQLYLSKWIQPASWVLIEWGVICPRASGLVHGPMPINNEVFTYSWWNEKNQVWGNEFFRELPFQSEGLILFLRLYASYNFDVKMSFLCDSRWFFKISLPAI